MNPLGAVRTWLEKRYLGGAAVGGGGFTSSAGLPAAVLSGVAVSPETALTFSAWYACINALATDLSAMPFYVERARPGKGRKEVPTDPRNDLLCCEPNRNLSSLEFRRTLYGHRFSWGNGYARIVRRNGLPVEMQLQSPRDTDTWPELSRDGSLWYQLDGGKSPPVRGEDMIHLKGLGFSGLKGYSPVALHRQGIGYGLAAEQFGAAFFGNAATPRGALKLQKKLTPEGMKNLRESVAMVHQDTTNAHRLMLLEEGTEYQQISVNPVDAEYLATRNFQLAEMCRIHSVPPPRIMDFSGTSSVYKALADMFQGYLTFTLVPELVATQQEFDRKFFTPRERAHGLRTAHDFDSLLRADPVTRMTCYEKRFGMATITPDEIREREGDAPTPGKVGDRFYVSTTYAPADLADEPEPAAEAAAETPADEAKEADASGND